MTAIEKIEGLIATIIRSLMRKRDASIVIRFIIRFIIDIDLM